MHEALNFFISNSNISHIKNNKIGVSVLNIKIIAFYLMHIIVYTHGTYIFFCLSVGR